MIPRSRPHSPASLPLSSSPRFLPILLVSLVSAAFIAGEARAQAVDLLRPAGGALAAPSSAGRGGGDGGPGESLWVEVDSAALEAGAAAISLDLVGERFEARLLALERRGPGDFTWRGGLVGSAESGTERVILTVKDGAVAGAIFADRATYELTPRSQGRQLLEKLDPASFPACGGARHRDLGPLQNHPGALGSQEEPIEVSPSGQAATVVDVLALYSARVRDRTGGANRVEATLQNAIDLTNSALANSGVSFRFRLVHSALASRDESGDMNRDLDWMQSDPGVAALRKKHGADLVGMLVRDGQYCGVAYGILTQLSTSFAPFAFQVTALRCALGNYTWAHEQGHLMGLEHNPENGRRPAFASFRWSYGHYVDDHFRTVMSYQDPCGEGCPKAPHFSNPEIRYQGVATGIANERDNHRTLGSTASVVARFSNAAPANPGPTAPGELAVSLDGLDARLTWTDRSGAEGGFRVYRGTAGGASTRIAELPADSVSFLDPGLQPATAYLYQVASFNGSGESKSARVEVETPNLLPVSLGLLGPAGVPFAGDAVDFEADVTGPVEKVEWSFGGNALGFSQLPCDAQLFCTSHVFEKAGTYSVTATAVGDLGQTAEATTAVVIQGPDAVLETRRAVVQSVIFGPRGATGTFRSTCWTYNASDDAVLVGFAYLPRGLENSDPARREVSLRAGRTLYLDNVLERLFGESGSQGSLALTYRRTVTGGEAGPPEARTACRSFVEVNGVLGSFGQLVPEEPEASWSAAQKVIPGVFHGEGFTATLLAANLDETPGRVEVRLTDAAGEAVGEAAAFGLGNRTMRFRLLPQMFPEAVDRPGPFTAHFSSNGIRFAASATLLENGSEDQIFIPARAAAADNPLYIPRVATAAGQFDAFHVSQLIAANGSAVPTRLDFELWQRGQNNSTPLTATRTVPAGETLWVGNLVADLFGLETAVGALQVTWTNAAGEAPRVLTYSLNQGTAGGEATGERFGMLVDSQAASGAAAAHAVDFGAEQSDLFRSSFGVVNLRGAATVLEVIVQDGEGRMLASTELRLKARQHLERNLEGVFSETTLGLGSNWTVSTRVLSGGPVLTYLANINASGDIFFVPGAGE